MKSSNFRLGGRLAFLIFASTTSTALMLATGATASGTEVNAPQMIDAFEGTFGVHAG